MAVTTKVFRVVRIVLATGAAVYFGLVLALFAISNLQLSSNELRMSVLMILLALAVLCFELGDMRLRKSNAG